MTPDTGGWLREGFQTIVEGWVIFTRDIAD